MALTLAKQAENSLSQFYSKPQAIDALGDLYQSIYTSLAQSHNPSGSSLETEVHSILDIAVQKVAEQVSWRLLTEPEATPLSVGVPALLDLCIDGVIKKYLLLSAAYKVLEDLMEGQTIKTCEKLWDLLEERKEKLSTREFIPDSGRTNKASLCLLRMCNALLRRVSKTHNSVFCGRILVFLSFVFTLSERSAVNLPGRSNMGNLTMFEDEEAFDAGEAMDLASSNAIVPSAVELDKERDIEATPIDYNLYRTFWDLQRFCRDHQLATKTIDDWEKFFDEINTVLSAFEGNAFSPDDLERSRDLKQTSTLEETTLEHHFFQPKYLTNSRLFRLQLRDPILRECMLTQFLILLHHLHKTKAPDGCTTPKSKCMEIQERVLKLLRETPSDGKGFSEMLTIVLERERNWAKWKMDKCPPYERFPPQETVQEEPKKRRLGDIGPLSDRSTGSKRARTKNDVGGDPVLMEQILSAGSKPSSVILEKIKASDRLTQVPMSSYISRFQEAWDPENGIEEEYWPDKDKLFCWRTLRMVMKTNVDQMHHAVDGANAVIRGILGITTETTNSKAKEAEGNEESSNEKKDVPSDINEKDDVKSIAKDTIQSQEKHDAQPNKNAEPKQNTTETTQKDVVLNKKNAESSQKAAELSKDVKQSQKDAEPNQNDVESTKKDAEPSKKDAEPSLKVKQAIKKDAESGETIKKVEPSTKDVESSQKDQS